MCYMRIFSYEELEQWDLVEVFLCEQGEMIAGQESRSYLFFIMISSKV
jgi:hypothetical protein